MRRREKKKRQKMKRKKRQGQEEIKEQGEHDQEKTSPPTAPKEFERLASKI